MNWASPPCSCVTAFLARSLNSGSSSNLFLDCLYIFYTAMGSRGFSGGKMNVILTMTLLCKQTKTHHGWCDNITLPSWRQYCAQTTLSSCLKQNKTHSVGLKLQLPALAMHRYHIFAHRLSSRSAGHAFQQQHAAALDPDKHMKASAFVSAQR